MKNIKTISLRNFKPPFPVVIVKFCDTFLLKFKGLMFTRELKPDQGIIIVENNESRINTAIHMMFMNYDITVLWLDKNMVVVDKALAKKWAPYYASKKPAQFVVELHESKFSEFSIGDELVIVTKQED